MTTLVFVQVDPRYIGSPLRIEKVKQWIEYLEGIKWSRYGVQREVIKERIEYWKTYLNIIENHENN